VIGFNEGEGRSECKREGSNFLFVWMEYQRS